MTSPNRDDFFTLIHKGQRRELFAAIVKAGTLDWNDRSDAAAFERHWIEIHRMLVAHAKLLPAAPRADLRDHRRGTRGAR
jgi:hypothetical protein